MAKYRRNPSDDEDDDDKTYSEEMEGQEGQARPDDEPDDPEESTYKKRYGDLRRHQQAMQQQHKSEMDQLRTQLDEASKAQIKFPKTDEEIETWSKKYPDVAAIVDTIARKRANEASATYDEKLKSLREMETNLTRREAESELLRLHPDFTEIRGDQAFHDWAETQPKSIQDALYVNNTDPYSAARAIDLYKADNGISGTKVKDADPKDAARTVSKGGKSSPAGKGKAGWSESKVAALSDAEYEKHEDDILAAMRSGKFDYDISGGAR